MSDLPLISVIVPVYNVAAYISPCLRSLQAQDWAAFEVIIVNDGSTDDSVSQIHSAISTDPRFQLIEQENGGLSAARNTGLAQAKGTFIAFVDSDDQVDPNYLSALYGALQETGADWAACAITFAYPDGGTTTHSAIHGAPDLPAEAERARLYPLESWCDVIPHFPSAWNKLYRRSLIEGLRFDEGFLWEDHTFFHRTAARATHLAHLPRPLYQQTLRRPGQITGADSDGVFQQFDVLERVKAIFEGTGPDISGTAPKPDAHEALARLTTRLSFERSTTLFNPERRTRFVEATRRFMARHNLSWRGDWDRGISLCWRAELAGQIAYDVILPWDGVPDPLADTLSTLADQPAGNWKLWLVVSDPTHEESARTALEQAGLRFRAQILCATTKGAGAARNTGLAASTAETLLFLDAGDGLMPGSAAIWSDALLRENADVGLSQFRVGRENGDIHLGFHSNETRTELLPQDPTPISLLAPDPAQILDLHTHPSAKIYRRSFLKDHNLYFGTFPLPELQLTLGAFLAAQKIIYFSWPGVESGESDAARAQWRRPVPMQALGRLIANLPDAPTLPDGWRRKLLARAAWEKLSFAETSHHIRLLRRLGLLYVQWRFRLGSKTIRFDPYIPKTLDKLLRWR